MPRSNISPILNPPQLIPPALPFDPCLECGVPDDWTWDGTAWVCAACHPEVNEPSLEQRRAERLAWGKDHNYPRLPYGFWTDHHPILGDRKIFYLSIAAGRDHWHTFMQGVDAATLDLVAQAVEDYTPQHPRQEAA